MKRKEPSEKKIEYNLGETDALARKWFHSVLGPVSPDEAAKKRMLEAIQAGGDPARKQIPKRLIWVAGCCCLALILGIGTWVWAGGGNGWNLWGPEGTTPLLETESSTVADVTSETEIGWIEPESYFLLKGRKYAYRFGVDSTGSGPLLAKPEELGAALGTVPEEQGEIGGRPVYAYTPVHCEAVVAVQQSTGEYALYEFFSFEEYDNNEDRDAADYLELYGIRSSEDLEKVELYSYPSAESVRLEKSLSQEERSVFYGYFSRLKSSSQEYFDALGISWASDSSGASETGKTVASSSVVSASPSYGANGNNQADSEENTAASWPGSSDSFFEGSVSVRITGTNGLTCSWDYMPNPNFLSRWKVPDEMAEWLEGLL